MPNHVPLNSKTLRNLTINTKNGAKFGDNISNTLTFPTEFIEVQKEYPILFSKNPDTGEFQSVVLFGLNKDENLFLNKGKWQANYIPAVMSKGPFLIGSEEKEIAGKIEKQSIIFVDMDNSRVNNSDGEVVFLDNGDNSPYLDKILRILGLIDDGSKISKAMFSAFNEYDLIEPVTLNIELDNGDKMSISGNYTIHTEKLSQLDGNALEKLNKAGFLQMAYAVAISLGNVKKLVDLKNARFK